MSFAHDRIMEMQSRLIASQNECKRLHGALTSCLLFALREMRRAKHKGQPIEPWEAIIRFCSEGGVSQDPLREEANGE